MRRVRQTNKRVACGVSVSSTSWDGEETATALRAAPIAKVEIIGEAEFDGLRARVSQTRASEPVVRVQKYLRMA